VPPGERISSWDGMVQRLNYCQWPRQRLRVTLGSMPGPKPTHESPAAKQKAYRDRNRERIADRKRESAALKEAAADLHSAVQLAAHAGDSLATAVSASTPLEVVQALGVHFQSKVGTPQEETTPPTVAVA
jgi:quinolinate synthase